MFRRISHTIALQFTAFVFLLLLVNGILFLAADVGNSQREMNGRLFRTAHAILESAQFGSLDFPHFLSPQLRERVRIANADGGIVYAGGLFENVPFSGDAGVAANMKHMADYAKIALGLAARIGKPAGYGGVSDDAEKPEYAAAVGLMLMDSEQTHTAAKHSGIHLGFSTKGAKDGAKKAGGMLSNFLKRFKT